VSTIPDLNEPLSDGRIRLRYAVERDIPEVLIAHQDDPLMYEALGMKRPPSGAELGQQLEDAPDARSDGARATLTILDPDSQVCRGQLDAHDFEWDHARVELRVWVAPQARNRGLARSALRLTAGWLFEACGIERAQLLCPPANEPLLLAARAARFQLEGTFRAHELQAGRRTDRLVLSLLPADLPATP
jgi:RimJ/RimL family protein N-acetyltransferase